MGKPQQCIAQTPGSLLSRLNSQVVTISFAQARKEGLISARQEK
jgi:hypothetical protein